MPSRKPKTKEKRKGYYVEFSIVSLFFWGLGLFFLLAWIFVLGILVGRGFLPEGVKNLSDLKAIAKFQHMVGKKKPSELDVLKKPDKDPKFAFYDELSAKKEEAGEKSQISKKKKEDRTNLDKEVKPPEITRKDDKAKEIQPAPTETGRVHTVQLASVEKEIMAIKMVNRLADLGYPVYYLKAVIKGKTYFRVRCGKFKTKKEASDLKRQLASREGIKGFVTKVDK